MAHTISWSEPELCSYGSDLSKSWFVYFTVRNDATGDEVRKQFRGGINTFHTKADRIKRANALIAFWKDRLERGLFNPWRAADDPEPLKRPILYGITLSTLRPSQRMSLVQSTSPSPTLFLLVAFTGALRPRR